MGTGYELTCPRVLQDPSLLFALCAVPFALCPFFSFSVQGTFFGTRQFFFPQKRAWKVRQLPDPSNPSVAGHRACLHVRSQKSMEEA
jgi:hypothetical protein